MAEKTTSGRVLRFGVFEADLESGELRKQGRRLALQAQPFRILAVLLDCPGEVVTRDEIRAALWAGDTFVDFDHGLNKAMNRLRRALGDSADSPRFIETIAKRGYRFIAPVEPVQETSRGQAPRPESTSPPRAPALGPAGISGLDSARPSTQLRTRALGWLVLAAGLVLAGGVATTLYSRRPPALTEGDTVVLAEFENRTGDAAFDDVLPHALSIALQDSSRVAAVPAQRIADTLRLMHRDPNERLTPELARDVCQRAGSKAVLGGYVANLGGEYVMGIAATNCSTGETLAQVQVRTARKQEVLDQFQRAVVRVRGDLDEVLGNIATRDPRLHDVLSTSSLEAFKAYTDGERMVLSGRWAIPFFTRAIELDPTFAYAHAALGLLYGTLGETTLSSESTRRAYELRGSVSEWERSFITLQYHFRVTGDAERAAASGEAWVEQFPQERTARNRLAAAYRQLGRFERALAEYHIARVVGGDHPIDRRDLALTYLQLGRVSEAAPIVRRALDEHPDDRRFRALDYLINAVAGNDPALDELADWARHGVNAEEVLALHSNTEASRGRLTKARELTRQAVTAARRHDLQGRAGLWLAQSALREALFGNAEAASRDAAAALELSSGWDARVIAAAALARAGDVAEAESLLDPLKRELPSHTLLQKYWLPAVEADIALHRGDTAGAISRLEHARGFERADASTTAPSLYPAYIRGLAYLNARQGAAAAAEFTNIIEHAGLVGSHPLGVLARLGLARSYSLVRDAANARVEYQAVLTRWKKADDDFAALKEVRAEAP